MTQPILKFVIIGCDVEMAARLSDKLQRLADITIVVQHCDTLREGLVRILRGETGLDDGLVDAAFVQLDSFADAEDLIEPIVRTFPGLPVMGLSHDFSAELALGAALSGAQEMVALESTTHPILRKMIGMAVHEKRWNYRLTLMAEDQRAMRAISRYQFRTRFQSNNTDTTYTSMLLLSFKSAVLRDPKRHELGLISRDWRDAVGHLMSDRLSADVAFCKLSKDVVGWLLPDRPDDQSLETRIADDTDYLQTQLKYVFECQIAKSQFGWATTAIPARMADFDEAFEDAQTALDMSRKSDGQLVTFDHPRAALPDLTGDEQGAPDLKIYFRNRTRPSCEVAHIASTQPPEAQRPSDDV